MFTKSKKYNKKKILLLSLKFFIAIFCFIYNVDLIKRVKLLIAYIQTQKAFYENEEFLKYCSNRDILTINPYPRSENPKVSIVSPIYNKDRYILRFLKSVQYQNFPDLEIVFVDDNSVDFSIDLIEQYQKTDQRIVLLKNNKNRGQFITRNIGVLNSRGKYIMISDSDDILSQNIVDTCYKYAEEKNFDMIRFNMYLGKDNKEKRDKIDFDELILEDRPVYQPELSRYIFYGNNNELEVVDKYINNKFLKSEIYIKAINSLNQEFLNMFIIYLDDAMMNYILYRTANSLYFIKKVGYYWTQNSQSINYNLFKMGDFRLKFTFAFLKLVFQNTKNTKYEKDMANHLFTSLNKAFSISYRLNNWPENFEFFSEIVNSYLKNPFITEDNKFAFEEFRGIIERRNKSYYQNLEKQRLLNMTMKNQTTNSENKTFHHKKKHKRF